MNTDAVSRALAEPGDYDPASAPVVVVTDLDSLALACRRMRRHAGLSQRQLARKAGVSASTVARIETCTTDPTVATLVRLAAAAGVRLEVSGLEATTFMFGIVENQRDRGGRRPPPHRLADTGSGWWDRSLARPIAAAMTAHQADLAMLMAVAAARSRGRPPG